MKIQISYTPEEKAFDEKNKDMVFNATDYALVVRYLQPVKEKKALFHIPKTEWRSCGGEWFREIKKEMRQALIELDKEA